MIGLSACTKDNLEKKIEIKEEEEEPEETDNVRLTSRSVTTDGETNSYSYIYESDQLKQIIRSTNWGNDTSFYDYTDSTFTNYYKSEGIIRTDTIYVSDGKKVKVLGKTENLNNNQILTEVGRWEYGDRFIGKYATEIRAFPDFGNTISRYLLLSYKTDSILSNSIVFSTSRVLTIFPAESYKYKIYFDVNNKIDSIEYFRWDWNFQKDILNRIYYTYSANQITVQTYDHKTNALTKKDILTLDNSNNKIIKVERFDASNVKYYEENRAYNNGNSNHELILYKHPLENNVILLKPYY